MAETEIWIRKCSSFEEEREADRDFWQRLSPDDLADLDWLEAVEED